MDNIQCTLPSELSQHQFNIGNGDIFSALAAYFVFSNLDIPGDIN
jgi:hypothetical protein